MANNTKNKQKSKYKDYLYILCTDDNFEFPVLVTDNLHEMSNMTGISYNILVHSLYRQVPVATCRCKVIRIDVSDPVEKFKVENYRDFCVINNISQSSFTSLEKFKKYCYGEI